MLERNPRTESDIAAIEQSKPARPSATPELLALREQATTALVERLGRVDDADCALDVVAAGPDGSACGPRPYKNYEATMHRVDAGAQAAGLPDRAHRTGRRCRVPSTALST